MKTGKTINLARHLLRHKLAWIVIAAAVALAVAWPTASLALASTSDNFDLQAAIDACPAGGTVVIPAGTYSFSTQVNLRSGVSLKGAGIDSTILHMPNQSQYTNLLRGENVSDISISDLTLSSPAAAGMVYAIHFSTYSNVTIERVKVVGCMHAIKADTQGANLTVRDFTAVACGQIYISNLTGGLFENLDLRMTQQGLDDTWHCLYIASNNHHLRFNNVTAVGSKSFCVQLWTDYEWTAPSDDIVFDGLYTTGRCLAISSGFSDVVFKNLTAISTESDYFCIMVCDPYNVTFDGFTGSGGPNFLGRYTGYTTHDVSLRNGSYSGKMLVEENGAWISNLVTENVILGGATGTTTPTTPTSTTSTTATTAAPTTTTTTAVQSGPFGTPTTTISTTTTTTQASTTTTTAAPATLGPASVTITNPADGATVPRGTVTVRVNATSSTRIGTVYFYIDGKQVGRDSRAPYSFTWKTGALAPGSSCFIQAVAYSSAGVILGDASATVTVAASTTTTTNYASPFRWR